MLVHIDRECHPANHGYFFIRKIDQDSGPYERNRSVEIPDELVVRYEKADCEHGELQDLLQEIYDGQDWPRFITDEEMKEIGCLTSEQAITEHKCQIAKELWEQKRRRTHDLIQRGIPVFGFLSEHVLRDNEGKHD